MSKYLIDEIERTSNIVVEPNSQVLSTEGDGHLEAICVQGPDGTSRREAGSLFVFIGAEPGTEWLPDVILKDDKGFVLAGPDLTTPEMKASGKFARIWKQNRGSLSSGDECPRGFCSWRCAARFGEKGGIGR